jgi:hypothetical protein
MPSAQSRGSRFDIIDETKIIVLLTLNALFVPCISVHFFDYSNSCL